MDRPEQQFNPPPKVSVCVPTYNGAAMIGATIESVLGQRWQDYELLIVDDGSQDGTGDVVRRYDDARIVYHRNETNLGPQGNWNRCLALARGTYFKLLPHDDLLHPECLQRQVDVLEADTQEALALVCAARQVIGPDGRVLIRQRGIARERSGRLSGAQILSACFRHGTNVVGEPGAVLFRRSLAERVGEFDSSLAYVIDLDYWVRLLEHGDAHYEEDALASFRVWKGSWSVSIGRDQSRQFSTLMRRIAASGRLEPSMVDALWGGVMPHFNSVARRLFYWIVLR